MRKFLLASLFILFAPPLVAQTVIFEDHFDNNIVADGWTHSYSPWMLWHFDEANSFYEVTDFGSTFGGTNEENALVRGFAPVSGAFVFESDFNWEDNYWVPLGFSHLRYSLNLSAGSTDIVSIELTDLDYSHGGDFSISAGGATAVIATAMPATGNASISVARDALNVIHYSITLNGILYSGSLGSDATAIDSAELLIIHSSQGGPGRDMLAETYTDFVRLSDGGGSTPTLTISNAVAGQTMDIDVTYASTSSRVGLGYSLAGGGPTQTSYGVVPLTPPFNMYPMRNSDANGNVSWQQAIPSSAVGVSAWFVAYDFSTQLFTNGVAIVIQ
jgi:hypothetical protein